MLHCTALFFGAKCTVRPKIKPVDSRLDTFEFDDNFKENQNYYLLRVLHLTIFFEVAFIRFNAISLSTSPKKDGQLVHCT